MTAREFAEKYVDREVGILYFDSLKDKVFKVVGYRAGAVLLHTQKDVVLPGGMIKTINDYLRGIISRKILDDPRTYADRCISISTDYIELIPDLGFAAIEDKTRDYQEAVEQLIKRDLDKALEAYTEVITPIIRARYENVDISYLPTKQSTAKKFNYELANEPTPVVKPLEDYAFCALSPKLFFPDWFKGKVDKCLLCGHKINPIYEFSHERCWPHLSPQEKEAQGKTDKCLFCGIVVKDDYEFVHKPCWRELSLQYEGEVINMYRDCLYKDKAESWWWELINDADRNKIEDKLYALEEEYRKKLKHPPKNKLR